MKKLFFTMAVITALFFSQVTNAQITLEKTLDGWQNYYAFDYYGSANLETNEVKLYNKDYSLYKIVMITLPENYSIASAATVYCATKNVFTNDNKVTFLMILYGNNSIDANLRYTIKLYDENGTVVKDFGYAPYMGINDIHVANNQYRLTIVRYLETSPTIIYKTDIYSLPGTVTGLRSTQVENPKQLPYPNPANTVITLPYKLEQGETSVMHIYNMSGQLIETKQIDFVFDRILLNVAGYAKGVYIYEVKGVTNRFVVE